jgi:hypothetical protein
MELVTETNGLSERGRPFGGQKVEDCCAIILGNQRQVRGLLTYKEGDCPGVQPVRLTLSACTSAPESGPARVDLIDRLPSLHQMLGKASAVVPGTLNTPLAWLTEASGPLQQSLPLLWPIGHLPGTDLLSIGIQCKSDMNSFVGIYPNSDHPSSYERALRPTYLS